MARTKKKKPEKKLDTIQNTVTIPLKDFPALMRSGKSFAELHEQRMTKSDWKIFQKMTPEDQASADSVIGQLRTGLANNNNRIWLEQKRSEIFKKYE